jgi:hypothetical protein
MGNYSTRLKSDPLSSLRLSPFEWHHLGVGIKKYLQSLFYPVIFYCIQLLVAMSGTNFPNMFRTARLAGPRHCGFCEEAPRS